MNGHSLLQGIFLTQESNQGLQHCRWMLYQLSHQGSQPASRPAEAQTHSPSPSSSRARSAPTSLLGRLSPARSDLSITRSLLSRDRSLGGQGGGDKALREDYTQGAKGNKVPLKATRRGGQGLREGHTWVDKGATRSA